MKTTEESSTARYLGTYQISSNQTMVGELVLDGEETLLTLYSDLPISMESVKYLKGVAYTGECITLIDCLGPNFGSRASKNGSWVFNATFFPHYVVVGSAHIDPEEPYNKAVHFSSTDLPVLFYDFDAFGNVMNAGLIIDAVLAHQCKILPIQAGEHPIVSYFTGKKCVIDAQTPIGKFSVHHRPSYNSGGTSGVQINNKMMASIEDNEPFNFHDALKKIYDIGCFLSVAAGRFQDLSTIRLETTILINGTPLVLSVFSSFPWEAGQENDYYKPRPGDVPLDPIYSPEEFRTVLNAWVERHASWHDARTRYLGCLRKENNYDIDRLVAAANMFDILPTAAVPVETQLSPELEEAQRVCKDIFKKIQPGIDRNSMLQSLSRMGKPSLPKKVAFRATIVMNQLGDKCPDLEFPARTAIKLRNHFVHGSLGEPQYAKIEPFLDFLTDTLEFIFAASDLIDAGWNALEWSKKHHGAGHSFCRYLNYYGNRIDELRKAVNSTTN